MVAKGKLKKKVSGSKKLVDLRGFTLFPAKNLVKSFFAGVFHVLVLTFCNDIF